MVAAAALRKGVFNLTRTGIAAELTAASEQRLPPVGGRCRIATKRGVQGSEAGAVVSGMRTPLQGVKHTLGTTTRDRTAVRSTATKAPVGLWLARGSQRLGMSNVVAVSCNPYEESKAHGRPQAAKKSPVGSILVFRVAAPSIRACLGRHVRLAGRCPNNSSLHHPLAAVVVVAGSIL